MPHAEWMKVIDNQTVESQGSIYSSALNVGAGRFFSIKVIPDSGDSVDIAASYQIIESRESDSALVGAAPKENGLSWTTPVNGTIIESVTTAAKADSLSPIASPWIRIKLTGNTANGTNTKATVWLCQYST